MSGVGSRARVSHLETKVPGSEPESEVSGHVCSSAAGQMSTVLLLLCEDLHHSVEVISLVQWQL